MVNAKLVLVRLLGGRGHWSYGIEQLRDWARGSDQRGLLIISGTAEGEAERQLRLVAEDVRLRPLGRNGVFLGRRFGRLQ